MIKPDSKELQRLYNKKGEIAFKGSVLHASLKNYQVSNPFDLEQLKIRFVMGKYALKEDPKSQFWKDAVQFMELKLRVGGTK
jgi:hypothetical protein